MKVIKVFILVLLIIGLVLVLTQKIWLSKLVNHFVSKKINSSTVKNPSPSQDKAKIFTDEKSGFSFQYPNALHIDSDNKKYSVCLSDDLNSSCAVKVNILVAPDEDNQENVVNNESLISDFKKKYSSETIKSEQSIVNSLHILKYSSLEETEAFIETPTYDYNFIVSNTDDKGNTLTNFADIKKDLDYILTTVNVRLKK